MCKVRNLKLLCGIMILIGSAHSATNSTKHDKSFKEMCDGRNGEYSESNSPYEGDKCTIMESGWQGESDETTKSYCERNIPFPIVEFAKANSDKKFKCVAESMVVCDEGWSQLYGVCFKITEQLMTRKAADAHCATEHAGGKVAYYHNQWLLSRHFPYYFPDVYEMWIDASEAITSRVKWNKGNNLAIVNELSGHVWQDVKVESFVLVDDEFEAFPLCQYIPPVTKTRANFLVEKYSEIYHRAIVIDGEAYIRSTSSLQRDDKNKSAHNMYCQGVMKPFFLSLNAASAVPTKELVNEILKDQKVPGVVRFSVYSQDAVEKNRLSSVCSNSGGRNFGIDLISANSSKTFFAVKDLKDVWRYKESGKEEWPKETCDGGTWSTGVSLSRKKEDEKDRLGLETMSDARYGPIYCQTLFETMEYGDCPEGYTVYERKLNGQKWCHKFFNTPKKHDDAEEDCQKDGAHLSGFEDGAELDALDKLLDASKAEFKNTPVWLGGKRREACVKMWDGKGFHSDPNHPCSRRRCFEWVNGAAPNNEAFLDQYWMENKYSDGRIGQEPNLQGDERCLELLKGVDTRYDYNMGFDKPDKKLNDIQCETGKTNYFICGREANIIKKELVQIM